MFLNKVENDSYRASMTVFTLFKYTGTCEVTGSMQLEG